MTGVTGPHESWTIDTLETSKGRLTYEQLCMTIKAEFLDLAKKLCDEFPDLKEEIGKVDDAANASNAQMRYGSEGWRQAKASSARRRKGRVELCRWKTGNCEDPECNDVACAPHAKGSEDPPKRAFL